MPLQIRKSVQQMVLEASAEIETLTVDQARALLGRPDVTFIDLRDPRELWRETAIRRGTKQTDSAKSPSRYRPTPSRAAR